MIIEAAKPGLMENVLNAQRDGFSMQMISALQLVITVIHGVKMENVKAVIKVMLLKMDNVSKIHLSLFQVKIVFVPNGKIENA